MWQRGPWLLVDRVTGHVTALKLPDYDPGVSQVSWFRDYGAYCGVTASGKSLYAVVAQLAARKPVLAKKLDAFDPDPKTRPDPVCAPPEWQREPLRVTFHPTGKGDLSFDIVPGSAVLVEDSGDDAETESASAGRPSRAIVSKPDFIAFVSFPLFPLKNEDLGTVDVRLRGMLPDASVFAGKAAM